MPTYEYACLNCDHEFEQFQSMNDKPLKECPVCGQKKLKRLVGRGAGLIFKGTGFYITDYKNKGGGEAKPAGDSKTATEAKAGGEAKSTGEAKPAPAKPASSTPAKPASAAAKT